MEFDATFLISIISFIRFVFIMNNIFYVPVMKIIQDRQNFVEDNFVSAKNTRIKVNEQTQTMSVLW